MSFLLHKFFYIAFRRDLYIFIVTMLLAMMWRMGAWTSCFYLSCGSYEIIYNVVISYIVICHSGSRITFSLVLVLPRLIEQIHGYPTMILFDLFLELNLQRRFKLWEGNITGIEPVLQALYLCTTLTINLMLVLLYCCWV